MFKFYFINTHTSGVAYDAFSRFLTTQMYQQRYQSLNNNAQDYPDPAQTFFLTESTERWIKSETGINNLETAYAVSGFFIMNWKIISDYAKSSFVNVLHENGQPKSLSSISPIDIAWLDPTANSYSHFTTIKKVHPSIVLFSVTSPPTLIEFKDIPQHLHSFAYNAQVTIREPVPVSFTYDQDAAYKAYLYPEFQDKTGAFDIDIAASMVSLMYPNAKIVVDIRDSLVYDSDYRGIFIDAIRKNLNKYN